MKQIACKDAGFDCDFVAQGETDDDVMATASEHVAEEHPDFQLTSLGQDTIRGLIRDA
jgi:predicted small metal-binding protein